MSVVLLSLFVSLKNLYTSSENIGNRHISKITHSFKFSLTSSNDSKTKKNNRKLKYKNNNKRKKKIKKEKEKKGKKKRRKKKSGRVRNRTVLGQKSKVNVCLYLTNHYNFCATLNHCQWHSTKRYSISILMKNTECSLTRTVGG